MLELRVTCVTDVNRKHDSVATEDEIQKCTVRINSTTGNVQKANISKLYLYNIKVEINKGKWVIAENNSKK